MTEIKAEPIQKNERVQIHIEASSFKGSARLDIREYYLPEDGKKWLPTKRGVVVPLELVEDFTKALELVLGEALKE